MRGRYPKFLSKDIISVMRNSNQLGQETIFNEVLAFLKLNAPYTFIIKYLSNCCGLIFEDRHTAVKYIRRLVNKYQDKCVKDSCVNDRYKTSCIFTLYCQEHYKEQKKMNDVCSDEAQKLLVQRISEYGFFDDTMRTHGDIFDKACGYHNILGTGYIGAHRNKDFESEQQIIEQEFKRLGLKRAEKIKQKK